MIFNGYAEMSPLYDYTHSEKILEKYNILPDDYDGSKLVSRYDLIRILINLDSPPVGVEKTSTFMDDFEDENEMSYVALAEMRGILKGKYNNDGDLIADLNEIITWKEALIMSLRTLNLQKAHLVETGLQKNGDNYLIKVASEEGLINYNLDNMTGLQVNESNLYSSVYFFELCALTNRVIHTPFIVNATGGVYIDYYVDRLWNNME